MSLKQTIKNSLASAYYHSIRQFQSNIGNRILMYHAFGSKLAWDTYGISMDLKTFESHLQYLHTHTQILPLNHNTLDSKLDIKSVSITIDDGYKDNLKAAEILEKYNIPYTIYIITGFIGKDLFLNKQNLQTLSKSKLCTLGTHSINHKHLSTLSPQEQRVELADSKAYLEDIIGKKVIDFSYPFGDFNDSARNIASEIYEIITTSRIGLNKANCDKKFLKRIEITAHDDIKSLEKKLSGYYDYLHFKQVLKYRLTGVENPAGAMEDDKVYQ